MFRAGQIFATASAVFAQDVATTTTAPVAVVSTTTTVGPIVVVSTTTAAPVVTTQAPVITTTTSSAASTAAATTTASPLLTTTSAASTTAAATTTASPVITKQPFFSTTKAPVVGNTPCTKEWMPVCAKEDPAAEQGKTFPNACVAKNFGYADAQLTAGKCEHGWFKRWARRLRETMKKRKAKRGGKKGGRKGEDGEGQAERNNGENKENNKGKHDRKERDHMNHDDAVEHHNDVAPAQANLPVEREKQHGGNNGMNAGGPPRGGDNDDSLIDDIGSFAEDTVELIEEEIIGKIFAAKLAQMPEDASVEERLLMKMQVLKTTVMDENKEVADWDPEQLLDKEMLLFDKKNSTDHHGKHGKGKGKGGKGKGGKGKGGKGKGGKGKGGKGHHHGGKNHTKHGDDEEHEHDHSFDHEEDHSSLDDVAKPELEKPEPVAEQEKDASTPLLTKPEESVVLVKGTRRFLQKTPTAVEDKTGYTAADKEAWTGATDKSAYTSGEKAAYTGEKAAYTGDKSAYTSGEKSASTSAVDKAAYTGEEKDATSTRSRGGKKGGAQAEGKPSGEKGQMKPPKPTEPGMMNAASVSQEEGLGAFSADFTPEEQRVMEDQDGWMYAAQPRAGPTSDASSASNAVGLVRWENLLVDQEDELYTGSPLPEYEVSRAAGAAYQTELDDGRTTSSAASLKGLGLFVAAVSGAVILF